MSPILLADDSPHAQRMGGQILREEGYEVVGLTDGDTVESRLEEVDPDLILADAFLPRKSGFDLCRYVKNHPLHRHVRVVLTAGLLEQFDEDEATRAGCDAILKKPFEASVMMATIRPLIAEAQQAREMLAATSDSPPPVDPEQVEAAVTLALDAAMPAMIREITERVLEALGYSKPASKTEEAPGKTPRSPR
jgi:PleD family two-component response regulator